MCSVARLSAGRLTRARPHPTTLALGNARRRNHQRSAVESLLPVKGRAGGSTSRSRPVFDPLKLDPPENAETSKGMPVSNGPLVSTALAITALLAWPSAAIAGLEDSVHPSFHPISADIQDLAEGDAPFWDNVVRYARFFVTVMLGTANVILRPVVGLLKNPITAVLAIAGIVGLLVFVQFTIKAMVGLEDPFAYTPSSIVTPNL